MGAGCAISAKGPHAIPRDIALDNRKDMKRKAFVPNVGKDGLHERTSQGKAFGSQNALRGKKGFFYKAPSKVPKPNHRKPTVNHVGNHSLGWEQNKWPLKPLVNTNPIISFGARSSENDISRLPLGEIAKRENNTNGEINNCKNLKGPGGDYGVV